MSDDSAEPAGVVPDVELPVDLADLQTRLTAIGLTAATSPMGHVIVVVTIDNPASAFNAVDAALHADFVSLFGALRRHRVARAVLLTGSKRAFCAGGDYAWFEELRTIEALEHLRRDAKMLIDDLVDIEIPIVCALHGAAVGLGASIALLTDAVFMAESASIADPHVRVGIVAGDGGTAIWPLLLGPMMAKRYLLTGDAVDASTALQLGLVTHVSADEHLFDEALAFAGRLADGAPLAVRATKAAVNRLVKNALSAAFDSATNAELVTLLSADHVEALAARSERRSPTFEGR
jgi:enoyl-CoA hydratase